MQIFVNIEFCCTTIEITLRSDIHKIHAKLSKVISAFEHTRGALSKYCMLYNHSMTKECMVCLFTTTNIDSVLTDVP